LRTIVVASSKGGVGKTTTAINLASALSKAGIPNTLIDCNIRNPHVGLYLGAGNTNKNLHTVLTGKHLLHETIHLHHSGLHLIPGDINLEKGAEVNAEHLINYKDKIKGLSGVKILDSASGITRESLAVLALADEVLVITTAEIPAIHDALKTIQSAKKIGVNVCGVVLNRAKGDYSQYVEKVKEILQKPIIAIIPEDDAIYHSQNNNSPVVHSHPDSISAKAFTELAKKLI